jgi:hypothetical protein
MNFGLRIIGTFIAACGWALRYGAATSRPSGMLEPSLTLAPAAYTPAWSSFFSRPCGSSALLPSPIVD